MSHSTLKEEKLSQSSRTIFVLSLITSGLSIMTSIWAWLIRDSTFQEKEEKPPDLENQLKLEASIQSGNLDETRRAISDLLSRDEVDNLPEILTENLSKCVIAGKMPALEYLLSLDVDVNSQNLMGDTALAIGCELGDYDIVKSLVNHAADVNIPSAQGELPLILAVQKGNSDIVELILNQKADVNSIASDGSSDLMIAIRRGFDDVAGSLISAGADLDQQDNHGESALMVSIQNKNNSTSRMLLENGADLNTQSHLGETALVLALREGNINLANTLLDLGADPNFAPYGSSVITFENESGELQAFGLSESNMEPETMM